MNDARYRVILYIIVAVILGTISIQIYWNYKNYEVNKQQLTNEVQTSMDNAVETYYANLAEKSTIGFAIEATSHDDIFGRDGKFDSILNSINFRDKDFTNLDSLIVNIDDSDGIHVYEGKKADSLLLTIHSNHEQRNFVNKKVEYESFKNTVPDSLSIDSFKILTSKVIFSMSQDTLNLATIDSLLKQDLQRKNLDIKYGLTLNNLGKKPVIFNDSFVNTSSLSALSNSTFLPHNSSLKIDFINTTKEILKRILTGILLSTLLVLVVISCLFYLLKVIKHQKQIAEVKNDFISNITHEFKTPISTIGVALESIKNFNVLSDTEKTKSYIDMSNNQLTKLNVMVEKLLETASLDSENLNLKKEKSNITELIQGLVNKHKLELTDKSLTFDGSQDDIYAQIDAFHFENAINNIIDNAIKYGGNEITVSLQQNTIGFTVTISDNGKTITKANKDKIFEKFYRIPKGNTHDVKGFGIGLYYAKKIIEKHGGAIHLNLDNEWTIFKITIPNG
ncbi:MAG: HAMP domain-containing sensor histidine kinase [Flavobacteriaceae bacterium]